MTMTATTLGTRAVERIIVAGNMGLCTACGQAVKFRATHRLRQVICNVYVKGRWNRVEHFHPACYKQAGNPHGPVDTTQPNVKR
jgi:hypothetical protein